MIFAEDFAGHLEMAYNSCQLPISLWYSSPIDLISRFSTEFSQEFDGISQPASAFSQVSLTCQGLGGLVIAFLIVSCDFVIF